MEPAAVKSCCATIYADPAVSQILGDSFHPGGLELTAELGRGLQLTSRDIVIDVACGRGTSALHLAKTFGCQVIGIDLSEPNLDLARSRASDLGLEDLCSFMLGDAEDLPLEGDTAQLPTVELPADRVEFVRQRPRKGLHLVRHDVRLE